MFDDERRSATIEALDALDAVAILGADMRALLREHPDIAVKLVISLGRRLRGANERIARQSFQTVQSRVATVLAQLVAQARAEGAGDRDVLVTATQADVAQLAGSSRESASRFLAVLERAGRDPQGRGRLTVHDPAALERYVYYGSTPRPDGIEFSSGGVVVREARRARAHARPGRRRVIALPKGPRTSASPPQQTAGCARCARSGRRRRGRRAARRRPLLVPARRPADRKVVDFFLPLRLGRHGRPRPRGRGRALGPARGGAETLTYAGERD